MLFVFKKLQSMKIALTKKNRKPYEYPDNLPVKKIVAALFSANRRAK